MTGLVAGIGCRRGAAPEAILAAVALALRQAGREDVTLLATIAAKRDEPGIAAAAAALAVPLEIVEDAAAQPTLTESAASRAATGLGSVAEAAALAAAGPGARLLAPRIATGGATCALAESKA